MLSRRSMLKGSLAALAAGAASGSVFVPLVAQAKAPLAGTQAPGYYRMMLGDIEITALSDGTIPLPFNELYRNTTPEHVDLALAAAFLGSTNHASVNAYLVNFGERLVMLDAGTGDMLGPQLGKLPANLRAAGYAPDQIDDIVLTHIHTDHSGGLVLNDQAVFPNAIVHAPRRDVDFWLDPAQKAAASDDLKPMFDQAVAACQPYIDAGRFEIYDDHAAPLPGLISSTLRNGHTPGHSALTIDSKGEKFVYWGDITHGDVLQFDEPGVTIAFDIDQDQAVRSRQAAFDEAVTEKYWIAGAHIAFPGIGHIRTDATNYDWVPMNYRADL